MIEKKMKKNYVSKEEKRRRKVWKNTGRKEKEKMTEKESKEERKTANMAERR